MKGAHLVTDVALAAALLVTLASVFGAVVLPTTFAKLHYLTPVTSVAAPLFALALVVDTGWGITAGLELLIVGLLVASGPVLQMAVGRVEAQRTGVLLPESPK